MSLEILPIGFPMTANGVGGYFLWFTYTTPCAANQTITYRARRGMRQAYKQHSFV